MKSWKTGMVALLFAWPLSLAAGLFQSSDYDECMIDNVEKATSERALRVLRESCARKFPKTAPYDVRAMHSIIFIPEKRKAEAPQKAIDYVFQHPGSIVGFVERYGYVPDKFEISVRYTVIHEGKAASPGGKASFPE